MALTSDQESHRPGSWKQQNKAHKHGRHRSKGTIEKTIKGRVSVKVLTTKSRHELKKDERRNKAAQLRQKKRDEALLKKRSVGGSNVAPFLIAVVPLCEDVDPVGALEFFKQADDEAFITSTSEGNLHISISRFKQQFSLVVPLKGDLYSCLDVLKIADTVLLLVSASHSVGIDNFGSYVMTASLAQGLPTPVVAVMDLESFPPKKQHERKQLLQKVISPWLPNEKVLNLSRSSDALNIFRRIGNQKQRSLIHRDRRPHLLAEETVFFPDTESAVGTLRVKGYIRGQPLSVNSLVHIPGWGDFQISQIDAPDDPYHLVTGRGSKVTDDNVDSTMKEDKILEKADPLKQESLESENIPDPMDAEQTWPTAEELDEAESKARKQRVKKIPKGMSEYQAAWILDNEEDNKDDTDESEDEQNSMNVDVEAMNEDSSDEEHTDEDEKFDTVTVTDTDNDVERYDEKIDLSEEEEILRKMKEAKMDQAFPDEVDTPQDIPARVRFQKYRGLESFRTSHWDPKENLPTEYSRIFQFENFDHTHKRILKRNKEGGGPGLYVTLHIIGVPQHLYNSRKRDCPLVVIGMLPHEQKMSVLNFVLKPPTVVCYPQPVKSKEQLIFHCGYRRFKACPIFSQHTIGTKHKYERFFHPESTAIVASVLAPIMFPPSPVLVFKENKDGSQVMVGTGSLLSVNPDRIVAKRVVLSGLPFKINKKSAVIRLMFFNREDIQWFKPVELRTKYGRRGHIKEPLGTHGHMKCVFNGQLKSQDTVLMTLYKRVFPKWTYDPYVESPPPEHTLVMSSETENME